MPNISIQCKDCGKTFLFTEKEQRFYAQKGFEGQPLRCESCRKKKKMLTGSQGKNKAHFETICAACGVPTRLPFVPKGDKPAFCSKCKTLHETEREQ